MPHRRFQVLAPTVTDRYNRYWLPFLLLAILARGAVVDGYMPSEDGLKVCPSGGLHGVAVSDGNDGHGHDDAPECPWKSVFSSAVPVPTPDSLATIAPVHQPPFLAAVDHAGQRLTGLPPTRAPPVSIS
ncbi:hypothetical protein IC757_05135 [Wenzhouxiangella sp. AB-CW3]|uniref:DUF2946 family protein n=1 Tax=Wenzhouxiangella sp. AB-CW3 TaxID=2771012 RepID=UPI00168BDCEA|nr:hypothetical protein [Wenzhouxiangella sp. AB-CW3]QOC23526.1 hypothetical protein IC757_05135 [Wenzhouxiangella sp. AB-CW3]